MGRATETPPPRWLLLIHSIPPHPAYFRAKVGKRLARVGAVAIKNSVYVLPARDATREDFQWIAREIVDEGGEATVCDAQFVEGLQNEHVAALFRAARQADYVQLADEARAALAELGRQPRRRRTSVRTAAEAQARLARLKKRLAEIAAIDFFAAPGREPAEATLRTIEERLERERAEASEGGRAEAVARHDYRGRTVGHAEERACRSHRQRVARSPIHRCEGEAQVRAGPGLSREGRRGDVRHVRGHVHARRRLALHVRGADIDTFGLKDTGLRAIARDRAHDIDIKDGKFARPEAAGFASLVAAIALTRREDEARIAFGGEILDSLVELYRRKRTAPEES